MEPVRAGEIDAALFQIADVIVPHEFTDYLVQNSVEKTALAQSGVMQRNALMVDQLRAGADSFSVPQSNGGIIQTFRGLGIVVDDGLPVATGVYTTALFGPCAIGYGLAAPRIAAGTEIENLPSAGRGGGQQILHSRINLAVHPLGFQWKEGSVAAESPSIAELALAANWARVIERKAVPLAFLKHRL